MDDIPLPPEEYMALVCGPQPPYEDAFGRRGEELAGRLAARGLLRPGARLLDIGCGCGRVARHLLGEQSLGIDSYTGFDRHPGMIQWCREHLSSRDPRFTFLHIDLRSVYAGIDGHAGTIAAETFELPFPTASFDGALVSSVFTHMPMAETAQYLRELHRLLTPGGTALVSVFIAGDDKFAIVDEINFLFPRAAFLAAVEAAGLTWEPMAAGSGGRQTWFALTHPATGGD